MYILKEITAYAHDSFMSARDDHHFMQHSSWGAVKAKGQWHVCFIGMYQDTTQIASALLMKRKLPYINKYIYYMPRGYIGNYLNHVEVEEIKKLLKSYIKKHKGIYLIIDPACIKNQWNTVNDHIKQDDTIHHNLVASGYQHQGFNLNFEQTQPRFTFRLDLTKPSNIIEQGFDRSLKRLIKTASNSAITIEESDDVETFYELMHQTAIRDGFVENNKQYYQTVYQTLKPLGCIHLHLAVYNPNKHLESLKKDAMMLENKLKSLYDKYDILPTKYIDDTKKMDKINASIESVTKIIHHNPTPFAISGIMSIEEGDAAWTLYGGNHVLSRDLGGSQAIYNTLIWMYQSKGIKMLDLFGSTGNVADTTSPLYGLYQFKKRFGGDFCEFNGEYHLVVRPVLYKIISTVLPKVRHMMIASKIKKIKKQQEDSHV